MLGQSVAERFRLRLVPDITTAAAFSLLKLASAHVFTLTRVALISSDVIEFFSATDP